MQARALDGPMNIGMVMDGFGIGGTELNATRTLEAFARRGQLVTVLHFHADGPLRSRIAEAGHRMIHVPIVPLWSPRIALRTAALARCFRQLELDVVHTQDVYSNILGVAAGRVLSRLPVISSRRWKDQVLRKGMTPMNAWAHRQSTLVLPNSPALVETLRNEGVKTSQIIVHENFVDDQALELLPDRERMVWRAELGIPANALVVGCVARLTAVKRHDILVDAFAVVARTHPDAVLALVGDGELRSALGEQVVACGLQHRVVFTGTLPNAPLPQQLFDVAVLTSANEGFPNSLVEGSASGVALVATSVGGVPDVLIEGQTGLTVPVADVERTAAAIGRLLDDAPLRRTMGAAGRALVIERFSESAAVERLLGIYRTVAR